MLNEVLVLELVLKSSRHFLCENRAVLRLRKVRYQRVPLGVHMVNKDSIGQGNFQHVSKTRSNLAWKFEHDLTKYVPPEAVQNETARCCKSHDVCPKSSGKHFSQVFFGCETGIGDGCLMCSPVIGVVPSSSPGASTTQNSTELD